MAAPRAIHLYNRQRTIRFDLPWLRRFAIVALAQCEGEGIAFGVPLESLEEIEVSIVSDRAIAGVHRRFMNIPGATDVITFEHGEIIIRFYPHSNPKQQFFFTQQALDEAAKALNLSLDFSTSPMASAKHPTKR